jgi:hypothetical protein
MLAVDYVNEYGLDRLKEKYGIKVSQNEDYPDLFVLNYDQIASPKLEDIVQECRSLVLRQEDSGEFVVESRSFDRFFNHGEVEHNYDITQLVAHEKIDGSLIGLWYNDKYGWLYRTRSMIMPKDMGINGHDLTWTDLIERNLQHIDTALLAKGVTYILELVSQWNRVVTKYDEEKLYILAERVNSTGEYVDVSSQWDSPRKYGFSSISECVRNASELPNLEEGYVLYTKQGVPVLKVKNPAYVSAHKIRGEGVPTPKRIMDLVIENEQDEYLAIFPEDKDLFQPYMDALDYLFVSCYSYYERIKDTVEQKDFAYKALKKPYSPLLFSMRSKGGEPHQYFYKLNRKAQYRLLEEFV